VNACAVLLVAYKSLMVRQHHEADSLQRPNGRKGLHAKYNAITYQ